MNLFANSIIQDKIVRFFIQSIKNDRLSHAYIFYGERGCGKESFAFELAKALNCSSEQRIPCGQCPSCQKICKLNHPDVKFIFPVSKQTTTEEMAQIRRAKSQNPYAGALPSGHLNIPIEAIRDLKSEAKYAPFEARKRVFIISGAEYFSREASNSFLKLLEEPPENLLLILTTNDVHALLDTIRSRCQPIHFPRFSDVQIKEIVKRYQPVEQDLIPIIRIAQNDLKRVFEMLQEDLTVRRETIYKYFQALATSNYVNMFEILDEIGHSKNRQHVTEFLDLLILWLRDALHANFLDQEAEYINLDYSEAIIKFARFYQNVDYNRIISAIERTRYRIGHNAHAALALSALAIEMKQLLSERTQAMEAKAT
jgi:DNA polymerase-3 subunit delta'